MRHSKNVFVALLFLFSFAGCLQETGVPIDATPQDPQDPMNRRTPWIQHMPLPTEGPHAIPASAARELTRPDGRPLLPTDAPNTNGTTSTSLFDPINNAGGFSVDIAASPGTEYRLAQMQFPSPRPLTAFAGVLLANNPGSFGPIPGGFRRFISEGTPASPNDNDLWVLGRIRIGLQGLTFSLYFDMPVGELIQLPIIAETVEISARLIKGIEIDFSGTFGPPFISSSVQDLVEPPVFTLIPGHQVTPKIVNANAYIGQGITAESNALRFASVLTANTGNQIPIVIPDGVNQVRVTAGNILTLALAVPLPPTTPAPSGILQNINWGFTTGQAINGSGLFVPNDCCWRDIPPSAVGIQLTNNFPPGPVPVLVPFQIEFKLGLQGTF